MAAILSICMPLLFGRERGEMVEDELHRITGKVERTLERMWRTAVKMIDRTVPSIDDNSWSLILLEGT